MKRKEIILLITSILVFLTMVLYIAFASVILNNTQTINNLNLSTYTGGNLSLISSGGGNLGLTVNESAMFADNVGNIVATANDNLVVTLDTDGKAAVCCTYDLIWTWDSNYDEYTASGSGEYVLSGTLSESYLNSSSATIAITSNVSKFTNTQIPNYANTGSSVYSTSICNNTSVLTTRETQTWNLKADFYNINTAQESLKGHNFVGKVQMANVSCSSGGGS